MRPVVIGFGLLALVAGCGSTSADAGPAAGGAAGAAGYGGAAGAAGSAGASPTGDTLWAHRGDGSGGVRAVTAGGGGRVVVVGAFEGSIDFGAGVMTSAGGNDMFVASFDAQGNCVWSRRFGGSKDDAANVVAMDETGIVYVSGAFQETMSVGDAAVLTGAGSYDVPLIVLDGDGKVLRAERYGGPGGDIAFGIDVRDGVVALIGESGGPISFGGATLSGVESSFVAAHTTAGAHVFSRMFDELSVESVAIDPTGHIAIGGSFNDPTDLGTGPMTPVASTDGFVARLKPTGETLFAHRIGDGSTVFGYSVATGPTSDIVFAGMAQSQGKPESFVQLERVTSEGKVVWNKKLGAADYAAANSVAVDAADNVIIGGLVRDGVVDLGCGPHTVVADPESSYAGDVLVAKLDPAGTCVWSKVFGPAGMQFAAGVAIDDLNRVSVGGYFQQSIDFGQGPMVATHPAEPFLATFAP